MDFDDITMAGGMHPAVPMTTWPAVEEIYHFQIRLREIAGLYEDIKATRQPPYGMMIISHQQAASVS